MQRQTRVRILNFPGDLVEREFTEAVVSGRQMTDSFLDVHLVGQACRTRRQTYWFSVACVRYIVTDYAKFELYYEGIRLVGGFGGGGYSCTL